MYLLPYHNPDPDPDPDPNGLPRTPLLFDFIFFIPLSPQPALDADRARRGEPQGKMIKVGQFDAYLAEPAADKAKQDAGILYIPDIFGLWPNSKLMADQFAANGYQTLIIDVFNGDQLTENRPADFDIMSWLVKGSDGKNPHTKDAVDPIVKQAIDYMKGTLGVKKLGAVGYCFGAKVRVSPSPARGSM